MNEGSKERLDQWKNDPRKGWSVTQVLQGQAKQWMNDPRTDKSSGSQHAAGEP